MEKYQFLPPLPLDKYEALRESIREKGVIEPVITDEDGKVLNGHHRAKACKELGIDYPTWVIEGLTEEQKQNLSVELNMQQRDWTKEQKKELAVTLREQGWTQERIGKAMGVDQRTVGRWLNDFRQMPNPDQPSPSQPDPELEKLKREIAARDALEREQEQAVETLRQELESERGYTAEAAHNANAFWTEVQQLKAQLQ
jgi:ParB-like chromosome segregation protein Spo0J